MPTRQPTGTSHSKRHKHFDCGSIGEDSRRKHALIEQWMSVGIGLLRSLPVDSLLAKRKSMDAKASGYGFGSSHRGSHIFTLCFGDKYLVEIKHENSSSSRNPDGANQGCDLGEQHGQWHPPQCDGEQAL